MRRFLLALVALLAISGCSSGGVKIVARNDLPIDVFGVDAERQPFAVYFVDGNRLAPSERPEGPLSELVRELFNGPLPADRDRGLRTAIPAEIQPPTVSDPDSEGVVSVDLDPAFGRGEESEVLLRIAQAVWTLDSVRGIQGVLLRLGGRPWTLENRDGELINGPVTNEHFSNFAPPAVDT